MRFNLPAALLLLALTACTSPVGRYTVRGNITAPLASAQGSMVYLSGPDGILDSVKVKEGKFSFSGKIDNTLVLNAYLHFPGRAPSDNSFSAIFVPDSEVIGIDLDYPVTVTGSPLTDAINKYQEEVMNLYYDHEADMGTIDSEVVQEAADSLYQVRMQKIVELSRETYLANSENALGMQALSILLAELGKEELEELVAQGGEFIRENKKIQAIIESK